MNIYRFAYSGLFPCLPKVNVLIPQAGTEPTGLSVGGGHGLQT